MDWVHCNYCGTKPTQIKMFLTFCGHVFCQNCVAKAKSRQNCHVCQKPLKTAEINKNMSPECMDFFKDVRQIATEAVAELKHVVKFQQAQREFFWKVKYSQAKRETEMFNEARNKHQKALQEVERRKLQFSEDKERLKTASDQKKELTEKFHSLHQELSRKKRNFVPPLSSRSRTEPPVSKTQRFLPPCSLSRKSSFEPPTPRDQSTSKIVTSTPITDIAHARRDYMNRMFTAGGEYPSPIPKI